MAVGPAIGGQLAEGMLWPECRRKVGPATTQSIREAWPGEVLAAQASAFAGFFGWRRFSGKPAPTRHTK